ncbi:hypothetical protein V6Z12_A07G129800 [Gossypium hirsutum]
MKAFFAACILLLSTLVFFTTTTSARALVIQSRPNLFISLIKRKGIPYRSQSQVLGVVRYMVNVYA